MFYVGTFCFTKKLPFFKVKSDVLLIINFDNNDYQKKKMFKT